MTEPLTIHCVIDTRNKNNPTSLLTLPGMGLIRWEPTLIMPVGLMWSKQAQNGRHYTKIRFDCFKDELGRSHYARAWPRKGDPSKYDIYTDEHDVPYKNVCSLLGPPTLTPKHLISALR